MGRERAIRWEKAGECCLLMTSQLQHLQQLMRIATTTSNRLIFIDNPLTRNCVNVSVWPVRPARIRVNGGVSWRASVVSGASGRECVAYDVLLGAINTFFTEIRLKPDLKKQFLNILYYFYVRMSDLMAPVQ